MNAFSRAACRTLALCLTLTSAAASATALEDQVAAAPMPHTTLGGKTIKVHYVRLSNQMADHEAMAKNMRQLQALCAAGRRAAGLAVAARLESPSLAHGLLRDMYWSPNRHVIYERRDAYHVAEDCGLVEHEVLKAELWSAAGTCYFNLSEGTKKGECDLARHAAAPAVAGPLRDGGFDAKMAKLAADPRMAAIVAQARKISGNSRPTGATRTLLGIECEVWTSDLTPGATICRARGGSFAPSAAAGNDAQAGILLEVDNPGKQKSEAVEARLDADVSAAIFNPESVH